MKDGKVLTRIDTIFNRRNKTLGPIKLYSIEDDI